VYDHHVASRESPFPRPRFGRGVHDWPGMQSDLDWFAEIVKDRRVILQSGEIVDGADHEPEFVTHPIQSSDHRQDRSTSGMIGRA
jgi:hypothetical protein